MPSRETNCPLEKRKKGGGSWPGCARIDVRRARGENKAASKVFRRVRKIDSSLGQVGGYS